MILPLSILLAGLVISNKITPAEADHLTSVLINKNVPNNWKGVVASLEKELGRTLI